MVVDKDELRSFTRTSVGVLTNILITVKMFNTVDLREINFFKNPAISLNILNA